MKGLLALLSIVLVWGSLILLMWPFQLASYLLSRFFPRFRDWNYSVWIIQDVMVNVIHGGSHKVTVSSKIGWMAIRNYSGALLMEKVVNKIWVLALNQENHCRGAIEPEDDHRYDPWTLSLSLLLYWGTWIVLLIS